MQGVLSYSAHTIALELSKPKCLYFDDTFIAVLDMTKRWQVSIVLVQVRLRLILEQVF